MLCKPHRVDFHGIVLPLNRLLGYDATSSGMVCCQFFLGQSHPERFRGREHNGNNRDSNPEQSQVPEHA